MTAALPDLAPLPDEARHKEAHVDDLQENHVPEKVESTPKEKFVVEDIGPDVETQGLPPTDRGWAAWRFLLGVFIIEALLWGFLLTFGVFQDYYSTHPPLAGNKNIPWIGVLSTGMQFLGNPISTYFSTSRPHWQRPMIVLGWLMCIAALIAASFCSSLATLAITQGVMYGVGFGILYCPILSMMNTWFVERRGLAYGVVFGATGISGVVLPFIITTLLKKYGYRTTLRAVAVALVCLSGPALPILRGRVPISHGSNRQAGDRAWLRKPRFYVFAASNLFQGFAFYIPFIYLPSYASALGYSSTQGAMLLALANAAQVIGQTAYGQLSDKTDIHILLFLSSAVSAIVALTLWYVYALIRACSSRLITFGPICRFS